MGADFKLSHISWKFWTLVHRAKFEKDNYMQSFTFLHKNSFLNNVKKNCLNGILLHP